MRANCQSQVACPLGVTRSARALATNYAAPPPSISHGRGPTISFAAKCSSVLLGVCIGSGSSIIRGGITVSSRQLRRKRLLLVPRTECKARNLCVKGVGRHELPTSEDPAVAERMRLAIPIVQEASALAKRLQADVVAGGMDSRKDDSSLVSVADFAVQALVHKRIAEHFPQDGFIAEESSSNLRANAKMVSQVVLALEGTPRQFPSEEHIFHSIDLGLKGRGDTCYTWVLDPIDGTRGFVRGEQFCVGLGFLDGDIPAGGLLGCPNEGHRAGGRLYYAFRGGGAYVIAPILPSDRDVEPESARLRVSNAHASRISAAIMLEGHFTNHLRNRLMQQGLGITAPPHRVDGMVKYGRVAAGEGDLILRFPPKGYREKIWDHLPAAVIVQEAGGFVTDQDGRPLDFSRGRLLPDHIRATVASSGSELHKAVLQELREIGL